jgi:hypothetical protein
VHFAFANPISDWWIQLSGWRDKTEIDKGDIFCNLLENHLWAPLFQIKCPPPHPPQPISLTSRYPPVTVGRVPPHPASRDLRALYNAEILQEPLPTGVFFVIDGCFEICIQLFISFALTTLRFTNINSTYLLSHHLIYAFKFLAQ